MTAARRSKIEAVLASRQPDLTILMERVHKPHNFAAVVRTCDAVGILEAHAITGDQALPQLNHTSQGAQKWVQIVRHQAHDSAVQQLKAAGFCLVAAHFSDRARDFREFDYTQPTALVLGTEKFGVSDEMLASVDAQVIIPMLGMTQSLNVSVACALILYEAQRQRRAAGMYAKRSLAGAQYRKLRFEWMHPRLARYCAERNLPYPDLDDAGELVESIPRSE